MAINVLMLNYEFPPLGGGAANANYHILKELANNSAVRIDLVTSSIDAFRHERFAKNINIHYIDINKKGNLHYQSNKDLLSYSYKAHSYAKKLIKLNNYNLVHAFFGIPCGFIAMQFDLPYIVSLRGSDVPFYNKRFEKLDRFVFQRLSRRIWKKSAAVITNSQGLTDLALATAPEQAISIIPNGVDIEKFTPLVNKPKSDKIQLVSTGRLIQRKGFNYLIEALQSRPQFALTLVGDGKLTEELKQLASDKNVDLTLAGKQDHKEIPTFLRAADIFVLPSLNEGMSNSVLEAMACGLPIITTDVGGSKELVHDNGFIIDKHSPDAIGKALDEYLQNPDLMLTHGNHSTKLAHTMSWKQVAALYLEEYVGV